MIDVSEPVPKPFFQHVIAHIRNPTVAESFLEVVAKHHGIIAGGAVRDWIQNQPVANDIDVFFPSKKQRDLAYQEWKKRGFTLDGYRSERGYTVDYYGAILQLLHDVDFKHPDELITQFDFTISAVAHTVRLEGDLFAGELVGYVGHINDVMARRIVIQNIKKTSLARVFRFLSKNYTIGETEYSNYCKALAAFVGHDGEMFTRSGSES